MTAHEPDVFERIRRNYVNLSNSFRRVADYLVENYQEAGFLQAARWAQKAGVSESVVVRFAVAIGYTGFPELLRDVQKYLKAQLSPQSRMTGALDWETLSPQEIFRGSLQQDIDNIQYTLTDVANQSFSTAVEAILSARTIYVVGLRGLASLAELTAFSLDIAGRRTVVLRQGDSQLFHNLRHFSEGDLLIGFAFHRYMKRTTEAFELVRTLGGRSIVITDSITAPAAQTADVVLKAGVKSHSFLNSYTAAVSVINALITTCALKDSERALASMRRLEEVLPDDDFQAT